MTLFLDWETTDIYLRGKPSEDPAQPHVCSVSAILDDDEGRMISGFYSLIEVPPGTIWAPKAFEANGLTEERCNRDGLPLVQVMETIESWAKRTTSLCAFSAYFELKFLKIAAAKIGGERGARMRDTFERLNRLCTMEASARHFVGPDARFIKLVLAYEKAFGTPLDGAHSALFDNLASRKLFYWLKAKGVADFGGTTVVDQKKPAAPLPAAAPLGAAKPASGKPAAIA